MGALALLRLIAFLTAVAPLAASAHPVDDGPAFTIEGCTP